MKKKTRMLFSFLLTLVLTLGLMAGMTMTAYAAENGLYVNNSTFP